MLQPWYVRENKWRAARYGMDAEVITDVAGTERHVADDLRDLLDDLVPIAERLGCAVELQRVRACSTAARATSANSASPRRTTATSPRSSRTWRASSARAWLPSPRGGATGPARRPGGGPCG